MPFERQLQPEQMDNPALDAEQHRHALQGLQRINRWSRSASAIWKVIVELALRDHGATLRVLDVASGGGDVLLGLAERAREDGLPIEWLGCDVSPIAVEEARRRAAAHPDLHVRFEVRDAFAEPLPAGHDIVMSSLFLHHLNDLQAIELLTRMRTAATQLVLVDDLRRTRLGYGLAWVGSRLLTRSTVVHFDGPVSVGGAYTPQEALRLASAAGLTNASVTTHWPQRYLMVWSRSCEIRTRSGKLTGM